jgi:hypothetical protein
MNIELVDKLSLTDEEILAMNTDNQPPPPRAPPPPPHAPPPTKAHAPPGHPKPAATKPPSVVITDQQKHRLLTFVFDDFRTMALSPGKLFEELGGLGIVYPDTTNARNNFAEYWRRLRKTMTDFAESMDIKESMFCQSSNQWDFPEFDNIELQGPFKAKFKGQGCARLAARLGSMLNCRKVRFFIL